MPRGQPLNTMNPFSNNKPRLTASERIRNKRDAAIYQGAKQRFQRGKNKCRNGELKCLLEAVLQLNRKSSQALKL